MEKTHWTYLYLTFNREPGIDLNGFEMDIPLEPLDQKMGYEVTNLYDVMNGLGEMGWKVVSLNFPTGNEALLVMGAEIVN